MEGAKMAGVTTVYCPLENKKDIERIRESRFPPEDDTFSIILIDNIYDILGEVFYEKGVEDENEDGVSTTSPLIIFNKINNI